MKTTIKLSILAVLAALTFSSCTKNRIKGTGPTVTETYQATNFSKVDLSIAAEVNYVKGADYSVEVLAQENVQDRMKIDKIGDVLCISMKPNTNLIIHDDITINITSPEFDGADISGSGCIYVTGDYTATNVSADISGSGKIDIENLEMTRLDIDISGSGQITIDNGLTDRIDTDISGSGKIYIDNVEAKEVKTSTSGSGLTQVWATESLDVDISGSGDVYYNGNPAIDADIAGSGKLRQL